MEVEVFTLCDAAADYSGKLSILGAFDRIMTRQLPAVHPHCAIALRVRFERIETGDHPIKINIVDADGNSIIQSVDGRIGVKFPENIQSMCTNLVMNINGLKFESVGQYSIDLAIDGRHEKSLPINVVEAPPQQQQ